ncbi:gephyrin-like molybdotransferase Glp [Salinibaculum salinum]|uniref:molybdopterin molybdotransferase MoeA n=1 Tax=Salinibaculum salinum TaxID=3131996 RepID=UPI0030EB7FE7
MDEAGFTEVFQLASARERLQEHCPPHRRTEHRSPADAVGHVLASDVDANRAVPHYDRAAMDGYAVRAADTFEASERSPVQLEPIAETVEAGQAAQVHTGSAVPDGADAVVMVEQTEQRDDALLVYDAVASGENVSPAGEDVAPNQHLFDSGYRLRPSDVALLRATDRETVEVMERPRVSVIPTGEELVPAEETPEAGEVVETNGLLVSSLVTQWGGEPTRRDIVTDEETALREAIEADTDHDIVVTTGGSSVGDRDLVPDVVADSGEVLVHGVAIKPGHPVGFGVVDETPVILLPGYPVSCLLNAIQFVRPAVAWLAGTEPQSPPTVRATLAEKLRSSPGERTFARVRLEDAQSEPGRPPVAQPVRTSGAGVMTSVALADGWVEIPESREGIPAGETVSVTQWERPVHPVDDCSS